MTVSSVLNVLLVAFAFGFVIFWHELGHFLAARWAGVRVEQFAVGMGQALVSWRKGIGLRFGNTQADFERRVDDEIARRGAGRPPAELSLRERYDVAERIGLGETEYRLSWIPLGGYVKPTGQDDLRPAAAVGADDPKAFGAKPVGKRMVIISAGVVMNVILAFALYVVLFLYGFNAWPAVVGQVLPGSPAQAAGLRPGDRIVGIDGHAQQDFTKLRMNTALLRSDEPAVFTVERPGAGRFTTAVRPAKSLADYGMSSIGVSQAGTLEGAKGVDAEDDLVSPALDALPAGSRVVAIDKQDVTDAGGAALVRAVDASAGRPVPVTIRHADGNHEAYVVAATLVRPFNADPNSDGRSIGGMLPRVVLTALPKVSPALAAGLKPGDVIAKVEVAGAAAAGPPSFDQFLKWTIDAGTANKPLRLTVERDGRAIDPVRVEPTYKIARGKHGIGVVPDVDLGVPVVAGVVPGSWAAAAGVRSGDRVTAVDGRPTADWPDVINALRASGGDTKIDLAADAGSRTVTARLSADDVAVLKSLTFQPRLPVAPLIEPRRTANPLVAAGWGYEETKASIFQVYVTLRRLFEGQVPLSNLSGPVGIFTAGTSAAHRGFDWLIWFTALISANLAVVNFLPIPIVDGGLFTFLVAEKITGRPPSPRVQTAAQLVGILLLGSLFLFVTYHDILRQWG